MKQEKTLRVRDEKPPFDPYWNRLSGTVDTKEAYIRAACREPEGFRHGARIK